MNIRKARTQAFQRQHGRCCYCGCPMWQASPEQFAKHHGVSRQQARAFQCTAEHLRARQDGGSNQASNIAAACIVCNHRRHQRKNPPEPGAYQQMVQKRMAKGGWHTARPE